MDASSRLAFQRLAKELGKLSASVSRLEKGAGTSQLGNSSLQGKSIRVYDAAGEELLQTIGMQSDGTVAVVAHAGPPPPAPSTPNLTPGPLSMTVQWDGLLEESMPSDFDHVEVHFSETTGFVPTSATKRTTMPKAGSIIVAPVTASGPSYVRLVAVSASGAISDPSAEATATADPIVKPGTITQTEIADDSVSTPKLQANAVTADKVAANAITADKLEAVLALISRIIAGHEEGSRVELGEGGIAAFNGDGNQTFDLSSEDGSMQSVGSYDTTFDGSSWSMGANGLWTVPGADLSDSPIGNPASQVAWQDQGNLKAFIEARTDGSLLLRSGGDINLNAGGTVNFTKPMVTLELPRSQSFPINHNSSFTRHPINLFNVTASTGSMTVESAQYVVIPKDGVYRIDAGLSWENSVTTGYRYLEVRDDIQNICLIVDRRPSSTAFGTMEQSVSRLVPLNAGQKVYLCAYQSTSSDFGLVHGTNSDQNSRQTPPAWLSVSYEGPLANTSASQLLVVSPIETDSYQYSPNNNWRSTDYVYQGDGGGGNHRGLFFYGAGAFAALAGKTIDRVVMYVRRSTEEGSSSAIKPYLRAHIFETSPSPAAPNMTAYDTGHTYPDYGPIGNGFKPGQLANVELPTQVGIDLASGTWKGLMFETLSGSGFSKWTGHSTTACGTLTILYH